MPIRYTNRATMEKLFSQQGIEFRIGEADDCNDVLNFYIDDATSTIDSYASQIYLESDLATSQWVKIRATWLACYRLSQSGGNPSLFYTRFGEIMEELKQVRDGTLPIPGLATREDLVPSMSNIEHDPRYRDTTRRVDTATSTPNAGGKRPRDLSDDPFVSLW